jgi:hypothetical protein
MFCRSGNRSVNNGRPTFLFDPSIDFFQDQVAPDEDGRDLFVRPIRLGDFAQTFRGQGF